MNEHEATPARTGYLRVIPGLDLKEDKFRLDIEIDRVIQEAKQRIANAGLELVSAPDVMVVEGTAIALDDPQMKRDYTWGPSVGIFVDVHVRNPVVGQDL